MRTTVVAPTETGEESSIQLITELWNLAFCRTGTKGREKVLEMDNSKKHACNSAHREDGCL